MRKLIEFQKFVWYSKSIPCNLLVSVEFMLIGTVFGCWLLLAPISLGVFVIAALFVAAMWSFIKAHNEFVEQERKFAEAQEWLDKHRNKKTGKELM